MCSPGSGVREDETAPGLRDVLLGEVEAERATAAVQLLLAVSGPDRDRTYVVHSLAVVCLQQINPDVPQSLLAV